MTKKIKIPKPKMPSKRELDKASRKWFSNFDGLKLEDYNETLVAHTIDFKFIPLPLSLIEASLRLDEYPYRIHEVTEQYEKLMNPVLDEMNATEFFGKLNIRSPKDEVEDCKFTSVLDFVAAITYSMRCFDDLCWFKNLPEGSGGIIVRPFVQINKKYEWRILIKDGWIAGISQYFYHTRYHYSDSELKTIEGKIRALFEFIVKPNIPRSSYIVDVICDAGSEMVIIETNPWGLSDPCLFESYDKLDGTMKVLTQ